MPIFEIKQEQGTWHLYGDRLGEHVTWLASSKFEKKIKERMEYLKWLWAK